MINYRELKIGDELTYRWDDFDGYGEKDVVVTKIENDHAIASYTDAISSENYWIDDDTAEMFSKRG